jgi:hypothetical protein
MSRQMDRIARETAERLGPPPTNPVEALHHILTASADQPDAMVVIQATSGIYPDAPWTGLRLGDLRALAQFPA